MNPNTCRVVLMTLLEIVAWGGFSLLTLYGTFKQFNLPKKKLIPPIALVMLLYIIPLLSFWENSSAVNFTYGVFFSIILISLIVSWLLFGKREMPFYFFLGVIGTFLLFWGIRGWLPYRPGWEPMNPGFLEKTLGMRLPLHHSTLFPLLAATILLFHCWGSNWRVFRYGSKHPYIYALGLGILIFAITSQIPEIYKYQTPWW